MAGAGRDCVKLVIRLPNLDLRGGAGALGLPEVEW